MHIVFVPPSTGPVDTWKNSQVPTGLLILAAIARQRGWVASVYPGRLHFPRGATDAARRILDENPDVVGFSTWCHTFPAQLDLAHALRELAPALPIVFGGPHASVTDAAVLQTFPWVDMVLRGEAEHSLPLLLDALSGHRSLDQVPGLSFRQGDALVRTPDAPPPDDLNALPAPAHDLSPASRFATIETGRGCPFACRFCSTTGFFRRKQRLRAVGPVLDEMEQLWRHRGVTHVTFTNDTFTVDRGHVLALCEGIRGRRLGLSWSCTTHVNCVDKDLLSAMAQAGCVAALYGVETGSQRMQRLIAKNLDTRRVLRVVADSMAAGIQPYCTFIVGFPEETPEDLRATLDLMRRLAVRGVQVHCQALAALPDTEVFNATRDTLRYDGFFSFSRATLAPGHEALIRAHPELFSAFHYLDSPAAPRDTLVGIVQLANMLRHFRLSARLSRWDAAPDPFAELMTWVQSGRISGKELRHGFEDRAPDILARVIADDLDARVVFDLERAAWTTRLALLRGQSTRDRFVYTAPIDLGPVIEGIGPGEIRECRYLVTLAGDDGMALKRLS